MSNLKYKVGDKVRIKDIGWYNENKNILGNVECGDALMTFEKARFCGKIVTISSISDITDTYGIKEDNGLWRWTDEMIEGLAEEEIIDLTSIVMETVEEKTIQNALTYGYNLPEGYQFVDEDGNVINATKIVLEKKKREYPKTYEECCKVLKQPWDKIFVLETIPENHTGLTESEIDLFKVFIKLKRCRDAYWKIAGEEMGLEKPWEPDWNDEKQDKYGFHNEVKYTIINSATFVFPTAEMRDAFYENFKEEIEFVKGLL